MKITRRTALFSAAAMPAAAVAPRLSASVAPITDPLLAYSFKLGEMRVATLLDATSMREGPKAFFGGDATDAEFARLSEENFIPADRVQMPFTPMLVDTGSELVLFDTGLGQGGLLKSLAAAGIQAGQIDVVVITHMQPDHIGGLMTEGVPAFPNARYVTGSIEHNFWSTEGANTPIGQLVAQKVAPLAGKMSFLDDGGAVSGGITAVASFGHTPGHMCYMLESGGRQLMLAADLANHYVWSLAYPDWEVRFDTDKAMAAASRRKVLDMLATDKVPFIGYHMPFPGVGYAETRDDGFKFVPTSYQLML